MANRSSDSISIEVKYVFQLHTVDMDMGEFVRVQIKRAQVLEYSVNRVADLVAIEAGGSSHHGAREFTVQGHSERLLHAKIVRPFLTFG
jgi:transposase